MSPQEMNTIACDYAAILTRQMAYDLRVNENALPETFTVGLTEAIEGWVRNQEFKAQVPAEMAREAGLDGNLPARHREALTGLLAASVRRSQ